MPRPVDAYEKRAQKQERDNQEDSYFPVGAYRFYKEKGKEKNKHKNAAVKERRYADNNPVIRSDDQLFKKIQKIVIRDVIILIILSSDFPLQKRVKRGKQKPGSQRGSSRGASGKTEQDFKNALLGQSAPSSDRVSK